MVRRIAIVEDEVSIRENYAAAFRDAGYRTEGHGTRAAALVAFHQRLPDLVVIDIGLADEPEGGFDLCRELRALSPSLPIIFLTARDSELDAVSGLRLGADDYLSKDISLPHLVARVTALFRRLDAIAQTPAEDSNRSHGHLSLDTARYRVQWRGQTVPVTITEFWLISSLVRHPGHVKSRDQLMQDANLCVDDHTITSHIKRMRKKFTAIDPRFDAIETVYGVGYRWIR